MEQDLQTARSLLAQGEYTCVLCRGSAVFTSTRRGVTPLLGWLEAGTPLAGFSAADRVVGKATACLYCLLQVRQVYAGVVSKPALALLETFGIPVFYDTLVPGIQNRTKDGPCPMEAATAHVTDPMQAPQILRDTLKRLQG